MYYKLPGHFKVSVEILDIKFLNQCCIKFLTFRLCFSVIIKIAVNFNFQGTKKSSSSPKRLTTPKIWDRNPGYCWLRICKTKTPVSLYIKSWLEEVTWYSLTGHYLFIQIYSLELRKWYHLFSSFSYNFTSDTAQKKIFTYSWSAIFYFTNFENWRSLGEKIVFFSFHWGFKIHGTSVSKTLKIKFGRSLKWYIEKKISDKWSRTTNNLLILCQEFWFRLR